jgi:hypothetical protein
MKKHVLSLLLLLVFMYSCSRLNTSNESILATAKETTAAPHRLLTRICSDVDKSYSWDNIISGKLVLVSQSERENKFLDMNTGVSFPVLEDKNSYSYNLSVSPDGNWFAYDSEDELGIKSLIVQSANRNKSYTSPKDGIIAYWLNNEKLVLWHPSGNGFLDYISVFNPFKLTKSVLGNDYPNIIPEDIGWDHWPSLTIFDPSLQRLVYVGIHGGNYHPGDHELVLWDRRNNQPITKINDFGYTPVRPIWKSDGSGLVFVRALTGFDPPIRQDEWLFLSSNGEVKQITYLKEMFQSPSIFSASLSPDERFLAFVLATNFSRKFGEDNDVRLLVLDMSTMELMDYCLTAEHFSRLIWSPDSRYLAFSQPMKNDDVQTLVLDVMNGSAFVVADYLRPEGWLNTEK